MLPLGFRRFQTSCAYIEGSVYTKLPTCSVASATEPAVQRPACKGGLDRQCGTFAAKWSLLRVGSVAVAVVHKPSTRMIVAPGFVRTFTLNKMCMNQCGLNTRILISTAVEGELGSRSMVSLQRPAILSDTDSASLLSAHTCSCRGLVSGFA